MGLFSRRSSLARTEAANATSAQTGGGNPPSARTTEPIGAKAARLASQRGSGTHGATMRAAAAARAARNS